MKIRLPSLRSLAAILTVAMLLTTGAVARAQAQDDSDAEPTNAECRAAIDKAKHLAEAMPKDSGSRYVAERHLLQAAAEAGNGEFDDCVEWSRQAVIEVTQDLHHLRPGESIKVLRADEIPPTAKSASATIKSPSVAPAATDTQTN